MIPLIMNTIRRKNSIRLQKYDATYGSPNHNRKKTNYKKSRYIYTIIQYTIKMKGGKGKLFEVNKLFSSFSTKAISGGVEEKLFFIYIWKRHGKEILDWWSCVRGSFTNWKRAFWRIIIFKKSKCTPACITFHMP